MDTNVVVYLLLEGDKTAQARRIFRKDPEWAAPILWRSEFRNVVATYIHRGVLELSEALHLVRQAEGLFQGAQYDVPASSVLSLSASSRCSAYDCELVALAGELGLPLVTSDAQVLKAFPAIAVSLEKYARQ